MENLSTERLFTQCIVLVYQIFQLKESRFIRVLHVAQCKLASTQDFWLTSCYGTRLNICFAFNVNIAQRISTTNVSLDSLFYKQRKQRYVCEWQTTLQRKEGERSPDQVMYKHVKRKGEAADHWAHSRWPTDIDVSTLLVTCTSNKDV